MFPAFDSQPVSRRASPDRYDKVSLPSIGSMFPGPDDYDARRAAPYPARAAAPWFAFDARSASTGSPHSPTSPSLAGSFASSSTGPTTVKSSPGASPFSDRLSLPTVSATASREWSAPLTIPVPASDSSTPIAAQSASPTPAGDSPPATAPAPPTRRRGKLPKHVTETLRTWLLSHADHPYPNEEEKKMLCNVTSLTLSQVSNWMINARRRILVPASKQQAALNATTPYAGISRASAAADLARTNRVSMNIPHALPAHLPHSHVDPYASNGAYSNLPSLSPAGDLHVPHRGYPYPSLAHNRQYTYPAPPPHQSYYGNGLPSTPMLNYPGLVPNGPARYYGDEFASSH